MKSLFNCLLQSTIVIGVSTCTSASLVAQDAEPVGVVRISKPRTETTNRGNVTQVSAMQMQSGCATTCVPPTGPTCSAPSSCAAPADCSAPNTCSASTATAWGGSPYATFGDGMGVCEGSCDFPRRGMMNRGWRRGNGMGAGMGYDDGWSDSGFGGGAGCPRHGRTNHQAMLDYLRCKFGYFIPSGGGGKGVPIAGHYTRTYPVNPHYSDARDGQMYAAQGYGIPMAVPLAPVVGHTYDYSWGIPSSRLTPVSHPAY